MRRSPVCMFSSLLVIGRLVEPRCHHDESHLAALGALRPRVPAPDLDAYVTGLEQVLAGVGDEHALAGQHDAVIKRLRLVYACREEVLPATLPDHQQVAEA